MALTKQTLNLNFAQGLDTKTDPFQIPFGRFLRLKNMVFTKAKLLLKRDGFKQLASLADTTNTFVTTFNNNLTALGTSLNAYSSGSNTWGKKATFQPLSLSTLSLIRSGTSQTQCDSAVAPNGTVCTVFTDNIPSGGTTTASFKYVIADLATGQNIIPPTVIPVQSGAISGAARVYVLGNYFMIIFDNVISAVDHLQYVAVNITNPTIVTVNTDISAQFNNSAAIAFEGVVINNNLYLAWNGSDIGGAIRVTYIDSTLTQHSTVLFATYSADIINVAADLTTNTPVIYVSFYKGSGPAGFTLAINQQLTTIMAPTQITNLANVLNLTAVAQNGAATVFYEVSHAYSYDSGIATNYLHTVTITSGGVISNDVDILRSVGLASKAFLISGTAFMLVTYSSTTQPTYFLMNSSGTLVGKLAYSNGGGYLTKGLPSANVNGSAVQIAYLFKDLLQPVNKIQGSANSAGVYSQTGINLATFTFTSKHLVNAEIGNNLHLSGGMLWMYDGFSLVEHGFHLWPDNVEITTVTTGGHLTAQKYFYVATYEWTDNQGNIHRSAPSIPVAIDISGSGTSTNTNTINVPTLRATLKTVNPIRIAIYRWSTAQQTYYEVTSLSAPLLNSTSVDSVSFADKLADSSIIGNNILYTTGGVVENIGAPAFSSIALFKSRLLGIAAEDSNLIWFSKQVIEATPVEMSDLFTIYVAPTISTQGSTGPNKCVFPMDDKIILFKPDALSYITGTGPDNTGANNDFSDPIFINSTVGCSNQNSIVFIPQGLMFQSDKGLWLLGRDLSTSYIGAPVEAYTSSEVLSALTIPGTNQVRFTLASGVKLVYDYFYNQWATFEGIPAVSSTLFQGVETFIDSFGRVFQENPGSFLDGANAVLMGFTTSWVNVAGLQGYERAYFFYLLGTYLTPHKLNVQIAYDYNASPSQNSVITPDNFSPSYGGDSLYGGSSPYGGAPTLEQWRVFFNQQKCQSFQITVDEIYDPSLGVAAGAGLTLSGLDLVVGLKSAYPRIKSSRSVG